MRILIVEDDGDLCSLMQANLVKQGYDVDACQDGDDGLRLLRDGLYDLVLLDRMLPGLDGLALLRAARREGIHTPVLMLTALGSLAQVVEGLDSGADDYMVKPFAVGELLARVRAMQRRPVAMAAARELRAGNLRLLPDEKQLHCADKSCSLSRRECVLLEVFLKNAGKTLPRSAIFSYVWGHSSAVEDANLDNYIHFVRERLREVGSAARIQTVRGVGYRLEVENV